MRKFLDGIEVEMSAGEIVARQVEEAAWAARRVPTNDETDQEELNRALAAEGNVARALAELLFGVIKGTIPVNPALTKPLFVAMLKAKMRT